MFARTLHFIKYLHLRFIRLKGDPFTLAKGIGIGVFVGQTPTIPFQTVITLPLAMLFRGALATISWFASYHFFVVRTEQTPEETSSLSEINSTVRRTAGRTPGTHERATGTGPTRHRNLSFFLVHFL